MRPFILSGFKTNVSSRASKRRLRYIPPRPEVLRISQRFLKNSKLECDEPHPRPGLRIRKLYGRSRGAGTSARPYTGFPDTEGLRLIAVPDRERRSRRREGSIDESDLAGHVRGRVEPHSEHLGAAKSVEG